MKVLGLVWVALCLICAEPLLRRITEAGSPVLVNAAVLDAAVLSVFAPCCLAGLLWGRRG